MPDEDNALPTNEEEVQASPEQELAPPQEQAPPEEELPVEQPVEEEAAPIEETPPSDDRQPSRREQLRVQQLLQKMQEPRSPQPLPMQPDNTLDYRNALEADDQVISTLEQDRQQYGEYAFQEGLRQAESLRWETMLQIDAPQVASRYKFLDKDSEEFNPAAASALNEMYLNTVGYDSRTNRVSNPNVRYSEYIDSIMELADNLAGKKVEQSTRNLAKQAATTGLRPDGSSAKRLNLNQAPEQMTDEELVAIINSALPQK